MRTSEKGRWNLTSQSEPVPSSRKSRTRLNWRSLNLRLGITIGELSQSVLRLRLKLVRLVFLWILVFLPKAGERCLQRPVLQIQLNFREVRQPVQGHSMVSNKVCLTFELRTKHRPYCSLDHQLYKHIIKCYKELKCYTPPRLPITSTHFNNPW